MLNLLFGFLTGNTNDRGFFRFGLCLWHFAVWPRHGRMQRGWAMWFWCSRLRRWRAMWLSSILLLSLFKLHAKLLLLLFRRTQLSTQLFDCSVRLHSGLDAGEPKDACIVKNALVP